MPSTLTVASVVVLTVAAAVSVAVAAGPAASFAWAYVSRLGAPETPSGTAPIPVQGSGNMPVVRRPWLLDRRLQAGLALGLVAATGWWGLRVAGTVGTAGASGTASTAGTASTTSTVGAVADTLTALPLVAVLGVACSVDAVCHRLPNRLLGPAAAWLAGATLVRFAAEACVAVVARHETGALWDAARPVGWAAASALVIGGGMFLSALLPAGIGMGDVKLCALCAAWLGRFGIGAAVTGLVLGFLVGGVTALALILARRVGRRQTIAFGPCLGLGAWLAWLLLLP